MRPRRRISPAADEFARSGRGTGEARRTVFDEYLRELQKVTLLTSAEEAALWQRYRNGGDAESRIRLIEAYQPLVFKLAMQLHPPQALVMDTIQEGTVGLIEAVERFDPTRGVRFSTFAVYRIRGRMLNAFERRGAELSLDQLLAEELVPGSALADLEAELSLMRVEDRVLYEQIRAAMAGLPGREGAILRAFLTREDPREVASVLRISLSHFYRLQKHAIERVRAIIRAPAPRPEAP
jgi:RNA polymerase sporulation-specific sigma factor